MAQLDGPQTALRMLPDVPPSGMPVPTVSPTNQCPSKASSNQPAIKPPTQPRTIQTPSSATQTSAALSSPLAVVQAALAYQGVQGCSPFLRPLRAATQPSIAPIAPIPIPLAPITPIASITSAPPVEKSIARILFGAESEYSFPLTMLVFFLVLLVRSGLVDDAHLLTDNGFPFCCLLFTIVGESHGQPCNSTSSQTSPTSSSSCTGTVCRLE